MSTVRWLLLSGAPRSGTTFLNHLLNTHPQIALLTEGKLDRVFATFKGFISSEVGFTNKENVELPLEQSLLKGFAVAYFRAKFNKRQITIVGDKFPGALDRELKLYEQVLGESLLQIYIVRAPSAVVASSLGRAEAAAIGKDEWHVSSVEQAVVEWVRNWEHVARVADRPGVLVVFYNRFGEESRLELRRMAEFLQVDASLFVNDFAKGSETRLSNVLAADFLLVDALLGDLEQEILLDPDEALKNHRMVYLRLPIGKRVRTNRKNQLMELCLKEGFSRLEDAGVWTMAQEAAFAFKVKEARGRVLNITLSLHAFVGNRSSFDLELSANGGESKAFTFYNDKRNRPSIACEVGQDDVVALKLRMPICKDRSEPPVQDGRALGILLVEVLIQY